MTINLTGKTALVCGSTQGIGRASAIELAKAGAKIILLARDEHKLIELVKDLNIINGCKNLYLVADFSNLDALKNIIDAEFKNHIIHNFVNNTGGTKGGAIINAEISEFLDTFEKHLICNHLLPQGVVEGMKSKKFGRIINIISTAVKQPINGLGVSNTIRGAVASWAKTMANELGQYGITVNNVLPGFTSTGRLDSLIANKINSTGKTSEEVTDEMLEDVPAGRFGEAIETAYAVTFRASQQASYINGINLPVDG